MTKRKVVKRLVKVPTGKKQEGSKFSFFYLITWIVGILVSLAVGFGMIDKTLVIKWIPVIVTIVAGWIVVISTILSAIIMIICWMINKF